jgi:hypothetical protein
MNLKTSLEGLGFKLIDPSGKYGKRGVVSLLAELIAGGNQIIIKLITIFQAG